ncbi:hemerythrin domain-containing protein [Embleya sp. NPDC050493]|uniref:hemerythrin domain-containing protein n=1 Tax=Embleya sp. NPDC050493 TaxID=3363989 RepID=UPI0037BBF3F1
MSSTVPHRVRPGRTGHDPRVDPVLIHAVHHALRRDLRALVCWARTGVPVATPGWTDFRRYLTVHHEAEDAVLWPLLLAAAGPGPGLRRVLVELEDEHRRVAELVATVDDCLSGRGPASRTLEHATALAAALTAHLHHEETTVLPLVANLVTPGDWAHFDIAQRKPLGPGPGAAFLSWLLEGLPPDRQSAVRAQFPPAVRLAHRALRAGHARRVRW